MTKKIPTLFALLILVVSTAIGVALVQQRTLFAPSAQGSDAPNEVKITSIQDTSFSVSFLTEKETIGQIIFGATGSLDKKVTEEKPTTLHNLTLNRLTPNTTYFFRIVLDGTEFSENDKNPWQQKTLATTSRDTTSPKSNLELSPSASPQTGPKSSFDLSPLGQTPKVEEKSLTIENPKEGEKIATAEPEFRGVAPAGTVISIKVESESIITDKVTANSQGQWNWSPNKPLGSGNHKITLSGNIDGTVKSITRNFTVLAAESSLPAFTSTPSGGLVSPTPSPSPSPTPTPTLKPTPTPTPKPKPVPVTGNLTFTLFIFILGIIALFGGTLLLFKEKVRS